MRSFALAGIALLLSACTPMSVEPVSTADNAARLSPPIIIAHRGASSERPEHTLDAYQRAIDLGADYIEPDLVMTRDGVLVARHENEISGTTDVADHPEFADRRTTKIIDGQSITGWFTEDFTLAELQTLRARERLPELRPANTDYNDRYTIPTLAEILALVQRQDRVVGLIPEIKHPSYFAGIGLPMVEPLVDQLRAAGYDSPDDPVMIQSFEIAPLAALDVRTGLRLVQLMAPEGAPADAPETSYAHMVTPEGLHAVAAYADAIGPYKGQLGNWNAEGVLVPTSLVADAHAAGLLVIPYTFRPENHFLPATLQTPGDDPRSHGDLSAEIAAYLALGFDGLFTDFVTPALAARDSQHTE